MYVATYAVSSNSMGKNTSLMIIIILSLKVHTYVRTVATSLATSRHVASLGKNSVTDILCNNVYINVL